MLQVFCTDVAKIGRDVSYVAMVVHTCCKLPFSMFHMFFETHVASVVIWILHMFSHVCCKCFIWMLRIFAMILMCFVSVSDACFKCFISL
jgi:hypothetical protein